MLPVSNTITLNMCVCVCLYLWVRLLLWFDCFVFCECEWVLVSFPLPSRAFFFLSTRQLKATQIWVKIIQQCLQNWPFSVSRLNQISLGRFKFVRIRFEKLSNQTRKFNSIWIPFQPFLLTSDIRRVVRELQWHSAISVAFRFDSDWTDSLNRFNRNRLLRLKRNSIWFQ